MSVRSIWFCLLCQMAIHGILEAGRFDDKLEGLRDPSFQAREKATKALADSDITIDELRALLAKPSGPEV